jgi:hypothetical protein
MMKKMKFLQLFLCALRKSAIALSVGGCEGMRFVSDGPEKLRTASCRMDGNDVTLNSVGLLTSRRLTGDARERTIGVTLRLCE